MKRRLHIVYSGASIDLSNQGVISQSGCSQQIYDLPDKMRRITQLLTTQYLGCW